MPKPSRDKWRWVLLTAVVLSALLGFGSARAQIMCNCKNSGENNRGFDVGCFYVMDCEDCSWADCETSLCDSDSGCGNGYFTFCVADPFACDPRVTGCWNDYCT